MWLLYIDKKPNFNKNLIDMTNKRKDILAMEPQYIVDQFCKDKKLSKAPKVIIERCDFIMDNCLGAYTAGNRSFCIKPTIYLSRLGACIEILLHELAHHYQACRYKMKTHHDSTFSNAKQVIQRWVLKTYSVNIKIP